LTQNGGLKYACELLRVRLIVAMVNIGMNKGAMICWGSRRVIMMYRSKGVCGAVTVIAAKD
jgi:hypothetical protein